MTEVQRYTLINNQLGFPYPDVEIITEKNTITGLKRGDKQIPFDFARGLKGSVEARVAMQEENRQALGLQKEVK